MRDYNQMNELVSKFGSKLVILAFPCNQFGHQENTTEVEILSSLKHVRPGGGYKPNFPIFSKVDVNGKDTHPLFKFLRQKLPTPSDEPDALMDDPKCIIWSPVCRSDLSWNFEKFLITPDGEPFKRYSRYFETKDIAADIKELLQKSKVK